MSDTPIEPAAFEDLVRRALAEDIGPGDITTAAIAALDARARATFLAKADAVVAGVPVVREVFRQVDPRVRIEVSVDDGAECHAGGVIARLEGPARAVLVGERTALNFLQYLSGIATRTREYVDAAAGRVRILDTRKTTPAFRALAKYAVRCGGGSNHRVGLFDGVLIKDNHIRLAGGIAEAVRLVRAAEPGRPVEVEAQSLDEVDAALDCGAETIMLDNFDDDTTRTAILRIAGRARVELSGNMTMERVRRLAAFGADDISVGALTHSAPAADISLEIDVDVRPTPE